MIDLDVLVSPSPLPYLLTAFLKLPTEYELIGDKENFVKVVHQIQLTHVAEVVVENLMLNSGPAKPIHRDTFISQSAVWHLPGGMA